MKKILFFLTTMMMVSTMALAQYPGGGHPGGGHPGGRPMGMPPGGPRGERPGGNFDPNRMDARSQQMKQKKTVREGDTFKVKGTLRDSTSKEPLVYVNVAVLDSADSSFVKGAATDFDGLFTFEQIPQGNYLLRINCIGYQTRWLPFSVTNHTTLGTILMVPGSTSMQEVKITAERPLYAMDGEKMVYNVSEDPSIQTGTTSDALQNAPGVEVDIEGNITLRGVSSVEIWINDKPSKLTAENLKTYLETLPANALDRIETITNPSAKYATSAEAVINIITSAHIKKNHFISFGLNGASQPSVSPWASYMWANERLSVNLYASGRYSYRENASDGWTIKKDTAFNVKEVDSTMSIGENTRLGGNLFANVSYTIDSTSDVNFHGSINYSRTNSYSYSQLSRLESFDAIANPIVFDPQTGIYLGGTRLAYVDSTERFGNSNIFSMFGGDYTKKFDNQGHNLRVFANGSFNWGDNDNRFVRNYNGTTLYSDPLDQQKYATSRSHGSDFSLNARYNRPYSKDGELSYGIGVNTNSDNSYYTPTFQLANGTDSLDLLREKTVHENENSLSGDINWTHRWGGFTLELGMGLGLNNISYTIDAQGAGLPQFAEAHLADRNNMTYLTYTPSLHTSYRTKSLHNFKANYTLRTRTPSATSLSSRRDYTEDSYSTGNPNLKNSFTHNAELGWNKYFLKFGSIGVEGYARYSTNEISSLTDVTDGVDLFLNRIAQFTMPYNMGTSYRYGTSLNLTYRPSGFINVRFYGNLYNSGYTYDYAKLGQVYSDNMWSYSFRVNAWAKVWNQYQIFASARYSSPTQSLFSTRKANYSMDCGIRSDFFKRKLSAFINVQDIFNWGKIIGGGSTNTNPFLLSESTSYTINSRYISAGVTLRFGKMELERNAKTGGESEGE